MTVEVEMAPGSPPDDATRTKSAAEVAHQIKARIGVTCAVDGQVPRRSSALARQGGPG